MITKSRYFSLLRTFSYHNWYFDFPKKVLVTPTKVSTWETSSIDKQ